MLNFEVEIFAREIIKPSSPQIHGMRPFKLTVFDQLTPTTYATVMSFYSVSGTGFTPTMMLSQLKTSLSETLNLFYPCSGRIRDNLFVDRFDQGVPFLSARTECRLSEFLKNRDIDTSLNKLAPCQPFRKELTDDVPLLVLQVTIFACGGIALVFGLSHKIFDGHTYILLGKIWSAIARGSHLHNVGFHGLDEASSVAFPPRNQVPRNQLSMMENLWFPESKTCITKRFVFNVKSIAELRAISKGELEATPSRIQALTGFIWKSTMDASRTISGYSSKLSVILQAVNLRAKTKPTLSPNSFGNLLWWASSATNLADQTELFELVELMRESIGAFNEEYLNSLKSEEGFEVIGDLINQLETLFSIEKPDIFGFTSWCNFGFYELDFGWGKPQWVAPFGKVGSGFRNHAVLVETKCGKGIEAWITLDEQRMSVLEKDVEFLKFASPHPMISSL